MAVGRGRRSEVGEKNLEVVSKPSIGLKVKAD
jgi:hypothetical protein